MRPILLLLTLLSTPAWGQKASIVTDIAPVQSLVAWVTQGKAEPTLLLKTGGSVHHATLKPSQARDLQNASHVFWVGPELLPQLETMLGNIADSAVSTALISAPRTKTLETRDGHDHHGHDHEPTRVDPHAWLDPKNAMVWVEEIARVLGASDPENAAFYRKNADTAMAELEQLDAEIASRFADFDPIPILTAHDAFQYFEARYGLTALGSLNDTADTALGAKTLRHLNEALESSAHVCVLAEAGHGKTALQSVNLPKGTKTATIDLFGLDIKDLPMRYIGTMRRMADQIAKCIHPDKDAS